MSTKSLSVITILEALTSSKARDAISEFREDHSHCGAILFLNPQTSTDIASRQAQFEELIIHKLRPLIAIPRLGKWIPVVTDLTHTGGTASGTGELPLHTDLVNTTKPPDAVALICERQAEFGGQTTLASLKNAVSQLGILGKALELHAFKEGQFYGLHHVGRELNPFPIIETNSNRIRFTGKLSVIPGAPQDCIIAFNTLHILLNKQRIILDLTPGDILLIDQHKLAHGRTPITGNAPRKIYQLLLQFK